MLSDTIHDALYAIMENIVADYADGDLMDDEVQQLLYVMRELEDVRFKRDIGCDLEPVTEAHIEAALERLHDRFNHMSK